MNLKSRSRGATNLLLVTFLIPVTAIMLGAVFLGERLALPHIIGMILIASGLAAIDGQPWRIIMKSRPLARFASRTR